MRQTSDERSQWAHLFFVWTKVYTSCRKSALVHFMFKDKCNTLKITYIKWKLLIFLWIDNKLYLVEGAVVHFMFKNVFKVILNVCVFRTKKGGETTKSMSYGLWFKFIIPTNILWVIYVTCSLSCIFEKLVTTFVYLNYFKTNKVVSHTTSKYRRSYTYSNIFCYCISIYKKR